MSDPAALLAKALSVRARQRTVSGDSSVDAAGADSGSSAAAALPDSPPHPEPPPPSPLAPVPAAAPAVAPSGQVPAFLRGGFRREARPEEAPLPSAPDPAAPAPNDPPWDDQWRAPGSGYSREAWDAAAEDGAYFVLEVVNAAQRCLVRYPRPRVYQRVVNGKVAAVSELAPAAQAQETDAACQLLYAAFDRCVLVSAEGAKRFSHPGALQRDAVILRHPTMMAQFGREMLSYAAARPACVESDPHHIYSGARLELDAESMWEPAHAATQLFRAEHPASSEPAESAISPLDGSPEAPVDQVERPRP